MASFSGSRDVRGGGEQGQVWKCVYRKLIDRETLIPIFLHCQTAYVSKCTIMLQFRFHCNDRHDITLVKLLPHHWEPGYPAYPDHLSTQNAIPPFMKPDNPDDTDMMLRAVATMRSCNMSVVIILSFDVTSWTIFTIKLSLLSSIPLLFDFFFSSRKLPYLLRLYLHFFSHMFTISYLKEILSM